jgi:antirepressor protein ant
MNKNLIGKINGVEIVTVEQDGEVYVPIKPICTALGIDDKRQKDKINQDDILASVGNVILSTGADGKQYEMFCLPLKYVYGWLFTINPEKVAASAKNPVLMYRRKCYDALYDRFSGRAEKQLEMNRFEQQLLEKKDYLFQTIKGYNGAISEHRKAIEKIDIQLKQLQTKRLNPQPSLFDE